MTKLRKFLRVPAYLVCLFIFFELASRLIVAVGPLFKKIAGDDDASHRLKWVKRNRGREDMYSRFDVYDPARGWALKPGLRDLPVFEGQTLSSNSRGLRGREEYPYAKTPGKTRIEFLGDSFIFGEEVSDDETVPARLQELWPGAEVLNLGVHGYGHDQMLVYLREEGVRYRPDICLIGFIYVDMPRNLLSFKDYAKPRFTLEDGRLVLGNTPVPAPAAVLAAERRRSRFLDLLTILRAKIEFAFGIQFSRMERITTALLDEIAAVSRGSGATPVFVYLPGGDEIVGGGEETAWREAYFLDYCRRRDLRHLSLLPVFRECREKGVAFKTKGHLDAAGNLIAARAIRDYLVSSGLVRAD